jgi:hypothetical protein
MMRVPEMPEGAPIGVDELEALKALACASSDLRHEFTSAQALADRLASLTGTAENYSAGGAFLFHEEALDKAHGAGLRYEFEIGLAAWRWLSAYAVLGLSVLARVVRGEPPLAAVVVRELCEEPTLGTLHQVLTLPIDELLVARNDGTSRDLARENRDTLMQRLGLIREIVAERAEVPDDQVDGLRISVFEDEKIDPMYELLLEEMYSLAEQTPYEISWYFRQSLGRAQATDGLHA